MCCMSVMRHAKTRMCDDPVGSSGRPCGSPDPTIVAYTFELALNGVIVIGIREIETAREAVPHKHERATAPCDDQTG